MTDNKISHLSTNCLDKLIRYTFVNFLVSYKKALEQTWINHYVKVFNISV